MAPRNTLAGPQNAPASRQQAPPNSGPGWRTSRTPRNRQLADHRSAQGEELVSSQWPARKGSERRGKGPRCGANRQHHRLDAYGTNLRVEASCGRGSRPQLFALSAPCLGRAVGRTMADQSEPSEQVRRSATRRRTLMNGGVRGIFAGCDIPAKSTIRAVSSGRGGAFTSYKHRHLLRTRLNHLRSDARGGRAPSDGHATSRLKVNLVPAAANANP